MKTDAAKQTREEKALEALVTAALHQDTTEVDSCLIAKYMAGDFTLTPEEKTALEKIECGPLHGSLQGCTGNLDSFVPKENAAELAALYRSKPADGFSKQTEEELERKRKELRERLRKKKQEEC